MISELMKENQFRRVLIGVIVEQSGKCSVHFVNALCESIKSFLVNQIVLAQTFVDTSDGIAMGVNKLLTNAYHNDFDGLVFISPNCIWEPQALYDIISSEKDCVSLATAHQDKIIFPVDDINSSIVDEKTGEIEADGTNVNFCYLSKYAIAELCKTSHTIELSAETIKLVIQQGDIYNSYSDENNVLHYKLQLANLSAWLNPNHTVSTVGNSIFSGNVMKAPVV